MKNWSFLCHTRIFKRFPYFPFPPTLRSAKASENLIGTQQNKNGTKKLQRNYEQNAKRPQNDSYSPTHPPFFIFHREWLLCENVFSPSYFALSFVWTVCHIIMKIKGIFFRSFEKQHETIAKRKEMCVLPSSDKHWY